MKTNLELYKVFYYVAKNGNITQASNELMVSQPAVSKSIKVLESDLDTVLFNRLNNGVSLTQAGELLYNKIKKARPSGRASFLYNCAQAFICLILF